MTKRPVTFWLEVALTSALLIIAVVAVALILRCGS